MTDGWVFWLTHWNFHPSIILGLFLLGGAYLWGLVKMRPRSPLVDDGQPKQGIAFFLGLLVIFLAECSPLHDLSEDYLFSAHMFQHMLLTMVVPPLLIMGTPGWLLSPFLRSRWVFRAARLLTLPLVAFVLFNGNLALWHLPEFYGLALRVHNVHIFQHLTFLGTGVLLWWPILSPLPELPRLSYPAQMLYLFLQSFVPAVLASLIVFSDTLVYQWYGETPLIWGLSPLADQQIAGLIMKLGGTAVLVLALAIIFFAWFNGEEAEAEKSWD